MRQRRWQFDFSDWQWVNPLSGLPYWPVAKTEEFPTQKTTASGSFRILEHVVDALIPWILCLIAYGGFSAAPSSLLVWWIIWSLNRWCLPMLNGFSIGRVLGGDQVVRPMVPDAVVLTPEEAHFNDWSRHVVFYRASFWRLVLRDVVNLFGWLGWTGTLTPTSRSLGDRAAGTWQVRAKRSFSGELLPAAPREGWQPYEARQQTFNYEPGQDVIHDRAAQWEEEKDYWTGVRDSSTPLASSLPMDLMGLEPRTRSITITGANYQQMKDSGEIGRFLDGDGGTPNFPPPPPGAVPIVPPEQPPDGIYYGPWDKRPR